MHVVKAINSFTPTKWQFQGHTFQFVLRSNFNGTGREPGEPAAKKADIVFLVDSSINVGRANFGEVMNFVSNLIDTYYNDRDDLRFALALYDTDVTDAFFLNSYKNKDDIISAIGQAEYKGGRRINTGAAIRYVQDKHFIKEKGSRRDEGTPQILILFTGGRSADDSKTAALGLKKTGVRIFAVGVGDILDELENVASESSTVARASTYVGLSELNEQILQALDDEIKGKPSDVYFLVDTSWSMGEQNFEHVRNFLISAIRALHQVGGDKFRFALVQYNSRPKTEFKLNTYPSPQGALSHIRAMSYDGGGTRTGFGLDFLIRMVVVLTDGRSQDDVTEPAHALHLAEVEVFAVGVQDALDSELRDLASKPYNTHVFSVESFLSLKDIVQDLVVGLCGKQTITIHTVQGLFY
uniref:Collagen, type VI, alpha 3 n=1 Tax=Neogobius melanostomus TaxID=47308 RepID=A0A8C6U6J4_9GOBI